MLLSDRVQCRKCEAMILPATARRKRGYCGVCSRTRGVKYWLREVGMVFVVIGMLVAMPFIVSWSACRDGWRQWRFPFDGRALLGRIRAVHADEKVARAYLRGVIDGYWDEAGEEKRVWPYPPRVAESEGDGQAEDKGRLLTVNLPRTYGMRDGARLRLGEITAQEIPTFRESLEAPVRCSCRGAKDSQGVDCKSPDRRCGSRGRGDAIPAHEPPERTAKEGGEDGEGPGKDGVRENQKGRGPRQRDSSHGLKPREPPRLAEGAEEDMTDDLRALRRAGLGKAEGKGERTDGHAEEAQAQAEPAAMREREHLGVRAAVVFSGRGVVLLVGRHPA
jgi:hypothetical protein